MKVIGLTGGIGSGKSTIREWFSSQGVPCFDSDTVGKELLNSSLKEKIIQDFGSHFYSKEGKLDRARLAAYVFSDAEALKKLNSIVHPAVAESFEAFKVKHTTAPFVIKEAAILFESGGYKKCDEIILVCAPLALRIQRLIDRDQSIESQLRARMEHQWSDDEKEKLSDYVIQNEYLDVAKEEAKKILTLLKNKG